MANIDKNDYNSSEDEDYVPENNEDDTNEDLDDLKYDDVNDDLIVKKTKENNTTNKKNETIEKDEEAEKNRINALWEDFQSDTNTFASSSKNETNDSIPTVSNLEVEEKTATKRKWAGQKSGNGLANVTKLLTKKNKKMSVLEKSNIDWKMFVNKEGIAEDLKNHSRSKESYLDKQDFLLKADFSKFQEEKALRQIEREKQFK